MKGQRRISDLGRRIQGWLPTEPIVASPPAALGLRVTRGLKSLGLAIGIAFAALLGALFGTQAIFGMANNAFFVLPGIAVLAAILFVGLSMRSLKCSSSTATAKLARNAAVALVAGFLFTIATSSYYDVHLLARVGSSFWWFNFKNLMTGPLDLWVSVAFVVVTSFSLDYSRRAVRS